ncbi:hypothetical protein M413DRAFT_443749 [Hebeloma cylindrosporum]|uniref:Uncharacterized protein n=1 Tax=Hebeloma cylindrosporum TaxID=76867 RepID=A0A0C2YS61_HEBCY|nr:hypothetical protein M413DRAFT_443749 [Hebeloma cylindrosporum h7]
MRHPPSRPPDFCHSTLQETQYKRINQYFGPFADVLFLHSSSASLRPTAPTAYMRQVR